MGTATAPIKVAVETDRLVTEASHFLGRTKKDIVDAAVREYVDSRREELHAAIRQSMQLLDGSNAAAVQLLSGFDRETLDDLGGVPEDK